MQRPPTLAEYNQRKEQFWAEQRELFQQRLSDPVIREIVLANLDHERQRQVPIKNQMTMEAEFAEVDKAAKAIGKVARSEGARKAGKARRRGRPKALIEQLVDDDPRVSEKELLRKLVRMQGGDLIDKIDEHTIWFKTSSGGLEPIAISSLRNRLSRAKQRRRKLLAGA
jgi:hypothetical protein